MHFYTADWQPFSRRSWYRYRYLLTVCGLEAEWLDKTRKSLKTSKQHQAANCPDRHHCSDTVYCMEDSGKSKTEMHAIIINRKSNHTATGCYTNLSSQQALSAISISALLAAVSRDYGRNHRDKSRSTVKLWIPTYNRSITQDYMGETLNLNPINQSIYWTKGPIGHLHWHAWIHVEK